MMGASEVLASCAGWLMVSASNTTSCRDLASSNMRSISLCTSAKEGGQLTRGSGHGSLPGSESCYVVDRKDCKPGQAGDWASEEGGTWGRWWGMSKEELGKEGEVLTSIK